MTGRNTDHYTTTDLRRLASGKTFGRGFGKAFDLWSRALEKLMEGHLEKNEKLLEVASAQLLGKASELGNSLLKRLRIGHWKSL